MNLPELCPKVAKIYLIITSFVPDLLTVGPDVKHLKVGDRVAMEPGATCRASTVAGFRIPFLIYI